MRTALFNAIIAILQTLPSFQGSDGTIRVYDWATNAPAGYPYVVLGSESLESSVLDSARDSRRYNFRLQIVGEKFGETGGFTQSQALAAMRATEDAVLTAIDGKYLLGRPDIVTRSMPTNGTYGLTNDNMRVVLTLMMKVDVAITIGLN